MARRVLTGGRDWTCGLAECVSGIRRQKGLKMRTTLHTFALAAATALVAAGCGSAESPPAEAPTHAAKASEDAPDTEQAAPKKKAAKEEKAGEKAEPAKPADEPDSEESEETE